MRHLRQHVDIPRPDHAFRETEPPQRQRARLGALRIGPVVLLVKSRQDRLKARATLAQKRQNRPVAGLNGVDGAARDRRRYRR